MSLMLIIRKDGKTIEGDVLCWTRKSVMSIVPNRDPDHDIPGERKWIIKPDKRQAFLSFVESILDRTDSANEGILGFFLLKGVGHRLNMDGYEWWLVNSDCEVRECQFPTT